MIVRVTLKDPDGFYEAIKEAVEATRPSSITDREWETLSEDRRVNVGLPFVKYGEYVTVEFDTGKVRCRDHEQISTDSPKVVLISAELSDAYVALLRAAEAEGGDCVPRSPRLTYAKNAVLRAGGGAK